MGGQIVVHAFRLVFRNLSDALKVSVGPYLIGLVVAALAMMALGGSPAAWLSGNVDMMAGDPMAAAGLGFASLVAMLVMLFISSWVAVAWHRFVLLEEYPGVLPALAGRPVWPYIGKAVRLALILIVVAIPVMIVITLALAPLMGDPGAGTGVIATIIAVVIGTLFSWLSIRLGLVLPAVAVGKQMTFRESWTATAALSFAILTAILILVVLNVVVSGVLGLLFRGSVVFGILDLVVGWVSVMVGLSILTTIYGHAVEGRPIT